MRTTDRLQHIGAMQQHNAFLASMCQHIDIKASIFLPFVAVVLLAYGYGPVGNPVVFALGMAFAAAYPFRIAARMLASRPLRAGGGNIEASRLFDGDEGADLETQRKLAESHKRAILHNAEILREKHRQNQNLIITSFMLFGYVVVATIAFMLMAPPPA